MGFLLFGTKKRGRNKEKEGEEIRNFGQNIYPRIMYDKEQYTKTKHVYTLQST